MKQPIKRYVKVLLNLLIVALGIVAILWLLPKLLVFFMPFVIGWLLSAIANPVVRFFDEKLKIKRKTGSAIVIVAVIAVIIAVIYFVISILVDQIVGFIADFPALLGAISRTLNQIGQSLSNFLQKMPFGDQLGETIRQANWETYFGELLSSIDMPSFKAVGSLASRVPTGIISVIVCLLSAYFFVADREPLKNFVKEHVTQPVWEKWHLIYGSLGRALGGYFKAQFRIEIWIYLLLVVGFSLLRIKYAMLIALGIALLDFLPVFGAGAVLLPWAVIQLFNKNYTMAIWLVVIWGASQLIRQIIQPKIVSDSIGLKPLPTLVLLFAGYKLGGFVGMLISVPLGIILLDMDAEGLFDRTKDSIRILWYGLERFRRLDEEDMEPVREEQERLQQQVEVWKAEHEQREQLQEQAGRKRRRGRKTP